MKVLLMGTHWDALNLPEGVKHFPHEHKWRINAEITKQDPLGRPYCTVCGGKPSFFSLREEDDQSFSVQNKHGSVFQRREIIVERDEVKDMGVKMVGGDRKTLASELKKIADRKHSDRVDANVNRIYNIVLQKAQKAAEDGSYYVNVYDEALGSPTIDNPLTQMLIEKGFTVRIAEDWAYSQHTGEKQMFVGVSWD